jgi:hypothetical protein
VKVRALPPGPPDHRPGVAKLADAVVRLSADKPEIMSPKLSIAALAQSIGAAPNTDNAGSNPALAANSLWPGSLAEERSALRLGLPLKRHGPGEIAAPAPVM